jgi:hypothetical protein
MGEEQADILESAENTPHAGLWGEESHDAAHHCFHAIEWR